MVLKLTWNETVGHREPAAGLVQVETGTGGAGTIRFGQLGVCARLACYRAKMGVLPATRRSVDSVTDSEVFCSFCASSYVGSCAAVDERRIGAPSVGASPKCSGFER